MTQETEDVEHQFFVLHRMISCLPDRLRLMLLEQLEKVIQALTARDNALKTAVHTKVDDAVLEVKALEFDLEATRRERDNLQNRLNDLS